MSDVCVGGGHSKFFSLMVSTTFVIIVPKFSENLEQDQWRGEGWGEKSAKGKRGREPFLLS